jgi:hypothetical protein
MFLHKITYVEKFNYHLNTVPILKYDLGHMHASAMQVVGEELLVNDLNLGNLHMLTGISIR